MTPFESAARRVDEEVEKISVQQQINDVLKEYGLCIFVEPVRFHKWNQKKLSWGSMLSQKQLEKELKRCVARSAAIRREEENARLKAALELIWKLEEHKHLGRPRSSDMTCIFCIAYLTHNYGAFGEHLTEEDFRKQILSLAQSTKHTEEK